jgi:hypothetical protein
MKKSPVSSLEKGNVLFLILVIVAIFSCLFMLLSQHDMTTRVPNLQKDNISSTSTIQYAKSIEKGVKRLKKNNVTLDQIQFYAPIDTKFNQDDIDTKIQLFHPDGGGVTYYPVDRDAVEKVTKTLGEYQNGNWHFFKINIKGIGSDKPVLIALLYRVKQDVCENINQQLNGYKKIPVVAATSGKIIQGDFVLAGDGIDNVASQCIKADDHFLYYHMLAAQ